MATQTPLNHTGFPTTAAPLLASLLVAPLAQLAEQLTLNQRVGGSIPSRRTVCAGHRPAGWRSSFTEGRHPHFFDSSYFRSPVLDQLRVRDARGPSEWPAGCTQLRRVTLVERTSTPSALSWRNGADGAMTSVQIKDVPEHTHAVLRQRAAQAHQSLQEYLRTTLIQEASTPTVEEVLDRASGRAGGRVPIQTATEILREDRDRR